MGCRLAGDVLVLMLSEVRGRKIFCEQRRRAKAKGSFAKFDKTKVQYNLTYGYLRS